MTEAEQMANAMQDQEQINRHHIIAAHRGTLNDAAAGLAFSAALLILSGRGVCFRSLGRKGEYQRSLGNEGAKEMLDIAQGRASAGVRKWQRSERLAEHGVAMATDVHLRAALEREQERTGMMVATAQHLQRARRFD